MLQVIDVKMFDIPTWGLETSRVEKVIVVKILTSGVLCAVFSGMKNSCLGPKIRFRHFRLEMPVNRF
jgi:hypothetical protein